MHSNRERNDSVSCVFTCYKISFDCDITIKESKIFSVWFMFLFLVQLLVKDLIVTECTTHFQSIFTQFVNNSIS